MSGSCGDGRRSAVRTEIRLTGADDGDLRLLYCRNVAAGGSRRSVWSGFGVCRAVCHLANGAVAALGTVAVVHPRGERVCLNVKAAVIRLALLIVIARVQIEPWLTGVVMRMRGCQLWEGIAESHAAVRIFGNVRLMTVDGEHRVICEGVARIRGQRNGCGISLLAKCCISRVPCHSRSMIDRACGNRCCGIR